MHIHLGRRFWIAATAVIVVFTLFVVARNALHAVKIKGQINRLTREELLYREQIERDSTLLEQLHYIYRRFGVEVSCRLICQNYGRLVYQRPRNCHSLPLSAGEFGRPVLRPIPKPHII